MRLHLIGLPHTETTSEYLSCAYTQKVVKFCRMFPETILYAGAANEAPCAEHVKLITARERQSWFGDGFDTVLTPLSWSEYEPYWRLQVGRAIAALTTRYERGDLILLSTGSQKVIADAFPGLAVCAEPFVGYTGIRTPHVAFESGSFMHTCYEANGISDGRDFDAVIPNFFDPAEFPQVGPVGGDYLLYVGRVMRRKGVVAAAEVAKHADMKLVVAGPGVTKQERGKLTTPDVEIDGTHVEYVGEVGVERRAELMAGAHALLAPTQYLEPFGGVAVEAMMAGTPALTTDFGAFRETVEHGVTGWRFRTLREALEGVEWAGRSDPSAIRATAESRFSLSAVRPMFEQWFGRIASLWGKGWHELEVEG